MPVRKMTIEDLPQVLAIQKELAFQNWSEEDFLPEIKASYAFSIVYTDDTDDKILGYAVFHLLESDSELLSIATTSKAQRKGIGATLLDAGLQKLNFDNGDRCFLEVREGNVKAKRFYEQHGFKQYGIRKEYYSDGENACLYSIVKTSTQEV